MYWNAMHFLLTLGEIEKLKNTGKSFHFSNLEYQFCVLSFVLFLNLLSAGVLIIYSLTLFLLLLKYFSWKFYVFRSRPFADAIPNTYEPSELQSGKQCLCRYTLPSCLGKGKVSNILVPSETASILHGLKIVGLADAVDGRINVIVNNGQVC